MVPGLLTHLLGPRWTAHFYHRRPAFCGTVSGAAAILSFRCANIRRVEKRIQRWKEKKIRQHRLQKEVVLVAVYHQDQQRSLFPMFIL